MPRGWCRRNITNRSDRPGSCRNRSAPVPTSWCRSNPACELEFEAFADYYRPSPRQAVDDAAVPEATTRVAMVERGEADIMYFVPGELIDRVKSNPKLRLAPG